METQKRGKTVYYVGKVLAEFDENDNCEVESFGKHQKIASKF